jgi:hypothetical protein
MAGVPLTRIYVEDHSVGRGVPRHTTHDRKRRRERKVVNELSSLQEAKNEWTTSPILPIKETNEGTYISVRVEAVDCTMRTSSGMSLLLLVVVSLVSTAVVEAQEWVDPQTPDEAQTVTGFMGNRELTLVFSDEFEDDGRTFEDGSDTRWTAEDRPGTTNAALHYYNSSHVTTADGKLVIQTTREDSNWVEHDRETGEQYYFNRDYQSGMATTWNKFCFTSGMIEISFQLPGKATRGGLWPAFWVRLLHIYSIFWKVEFLVLPFLFSPCHRCLETWLDLVT